jgi:hypothetical protein
VVVPPTPKTSEKKPGTDQRARRHRLAGKYKATQGVNTACDACEAGKYKAAAGVNIGCDACEAGKYKATSGVNINCDNCQAGKYKTAAGLNTACDACECTDCAAAPGSFCKEGSSYGSSAAGTTCPLGFFCPGGAQDKQLCAHAGAVPGGQASLAKEEA